MKKISVRLKITLWYTAITILISIIALIAVTQTSAKIAERDTISRLTRIVNNISTPPPDRMGKPRPFPNFMFYDQGVHIAAFDEDFNLVFGKLPINENEILSFRHDSVRKETLSGNSFYVYDKKVNITTPDGSFVWIKGITAEDTSVYGLQTALKTNAMISFILILVAAFGGYFIITRALAPVNKIRKTAQEISESNDLSRRINIGNGKDEISALANTFDEMLTKIETTFENEKQFTSDASHELRTPVAVILSECEYMEEYAKTEAEFKESARSINNQAEKMSKLISELLTISRMDKNTLPLNFEETDISELLTFVCDEVSEINKKDITLNCDITPAISACVDRSLIARLFINLISNAYQYSNDGSSVYVSLKKNGSGISFKVKDEGIGIPREDLPKIWKRFYQVDSSRSSNEDNSMGLGLSMVKWIAERHNGTVTVKSALNEGSEFTFTFNEKS